MYAVVGCSTCSALWVVETNVDSTGCPRCGRRHQIDRLEQFTTTDEVAEARAVRAAMLADRQDSPDSFDVQETVEAEVDEPVVGDREYLAGSGVDPDAVEAAGDRAVDGGGATDQRTVVEEAIRTLDAPSMDAVVGYASEYGVGESAARTVVEKLVREGVVMEGRDGYRIL